MGILEIANGLLENYPLCDRCLGRQFAQLGYGVDNAERGRALKTGIMLNTFAQTNAEEHPNKMRTLAEHGNFPPAVQYLKKRKADLQPFEKCHLCNNLYNELDALSDRVVRKLTESDIQFNTFLVGARIPGKTLESEDAIRSKWKLTWGESIKSEFTRVVGKLLQTRLERRPSFLSPDMVIIVDLNKDEIEIQPQPLFIYGRYRKLARGIPQSAWHCSQCHGTGCEACNWTGKKYQVSISELLEKPFLEAYSGEAVKFHAAGREDVDARTLGPGRPFVIEVKKPRIRHVELSPLEEDINQKLKEYLQISGLTVSNKQTVRRLKVSSPKTTKTYRAIVETADSVPDEKKEEAEEKLKNVTIRQQTPTRVLHRRADKARSKRIYDVQLTRGQAPNQLEVRVTCQGGVYVKEFITGDSGRTTPSLAEILNTALRCLELDIVDIQWEDSDIGKALQGIPNEE